MSLQELGMKYNTDKATEHHFCEIYEKLLPKQIDELWEIGVDWACSLNMWADYYKNAKIIGYDNNIKPSLNILHENITIEYLDQGNLDMLNNLAVRSNIDIIVDDGSHYIPHQIMTFETLFNCLKSEGIYIIEDLHTSSDIWTGFGYENNKGTLQYLNDIIINKVPDNYPSQINTNNIIDKIKSISIQSNNYTYNKRSITAIITHI